MSDFSSLRGPMDLLFKSGAFAFWVTVSIILIMLVVTVIIVVKQRNKKSLIGGDMMEGMEGVASTMIDLEGDVFVNSELWKAQSLGEVIAKGERVIVRKVKGLTLIVEKIQEKGD